MLDGGKTLFSTGKDWSSVRELNLMTTKPFLYVFNADESVLGDEARVAQLRALVAPADAVFLDAKIESELQELDEAIRLILGTAPGERPMRPDFGCGIHDLVFASPDATTAGRIAHEVRVALLRWEPRIEVLDVDIGFEAADQGVLLIDIEYRPVRTNDPRNLVFPFYVIPGGD